MTNTTERKMKALMDLPFYKIEPTDDPAVATMRLGKAYTLLIDVRESPDQWQIAFDDGTQQLSFDLGSGKVPHTFTASADALVKDYTRALADMAMDEGPLDDDEPVNDPVKNLEESGFDLGNVPPEEPQPTPQPRPPARRSAKRAAPKQPAVIPEQMRSKQITDLSLQDIKQYICPKATDKEAFMFLRLCQARGLNPFVNEAYLIKYGQNDTAQMVVGKEAFTRRAELNPNIDGYEAGIIVRDEAGEIERRHGTFILKEETLLGGWAKVYRKDRKYPIVAEVALEEYIGRKKDGSITKMWREKPATMIRKVALVQALREAMPSEFSGMYDAAEMGVDTPYMDAQYEVVA